jgi:outer membrane protein assembly factor BamA
VKDTVVMKGKNAKVIYSIRTGENHLINDVYLDVDDSAIESIVAHSMKETKLQKGAAFTMDLVDEERSRIANMLKDEGYFNFSQENITNVTLDTFNKALLKDDYNPFETIINTLAAQTEEKKNPTLDITIHIHADDTSDAYKKYYLNKLSVYPDYISREDIRDSSMLEKHYKEARFRYHEYYIKSPVLYNNMLLDKGRVFRQSDYDNTINRLNDLDVFKSVRVVQIEDKKKSTKDSGFINSYVLLSPSKKYDFSTNFEISRGATYDVGSALLFTFRNKNFLKGANLLNISLRGGIESNYDQTYSPDFFKKFRLFTRSAGINASLNFPKFIAPYGQLFKNKNTPRTIFSVGANMLERVQFFNATNITFDYGYNWRETPTRTWEFSPSTISNFNLPKISDSFQKRLDSIPFLKKLYTPVFIEGESFVFTFSNQLNRKGRSYSYVRLGLEEAGGLMGAINKIAPLGFHFAQYWKLDFDVRRYINRLHSQIATRFYGGFGLPYGGATTLPYIKQYFAGGPYSIRGWRIRTLGPGSYYNPAQDTTKATYQFIDRTGDIKLELNSEYRFDIVQLFSGVIKMKGAVFVDAGNIWYARPNADYPGGDFQFYKLYKDIAMSAGGGLRFDLAGFFVFRLDAAFPVKKPYGANNGWVIDEIALGQKHWRNENIVLNIAIGYPF